VTGGFVIPQREQPVVKMPDAMSAHATCRSTSRLPAEEPLFHIYWEECDAMFREGITASFEEGAIFSSS